MVHHEISSLDALAFRLGVGRATVVRTMSGKQAPSARLLAALCVNLGLQLDALVEPAATVPGSAA